jgi:3-oxoadipate enol-lactonase
MDFQTGHANINGARLFYEIGGAGKPLVFIHGLGADGRIWDAQVEFFVRRCRVLRYDLRGFGRSSLPVEGEFYSHAADLLSLLESLSLAGAVLVGQSIGGAIALDFALTNTGMAQALVLVDSALGGFEMSQAWKDSWAPIYARGAEGGMQAALPLLLEHALFAPARLQPAVASRLEQILSGYSGWHVTHADPQVELDPPAIQCLYEIRIPTLVVIGEKDLPDFHVIAGILANNITAARRAMVTGAGHVLPLEAPERLNHLLSAFLTRENLY